MGDSDQEEEEDADQRRDLVFYDPAMAHEDWHYNGEPAPPMLLPYHHHREMTQEYHDGVAPFAPPVYQEEQQPQPQPQHVALDYASQTPVQVYAAFCTATESRVSCMVTLIRRMIACFGGDIHHVELVFEFADRRTFSCVIQTGRTVELREPALDTAYSVSTNSWEWWGLRLSEEERRKAWDFSLCQLGKPYNYSGMYGFVPCIGCCFTGCSDSANDGSAWFCSQLVMSTLQHLRPTDFGEYDAHRIHPQQLHDIMIEHQLAIQAQILCMGDAASRFVV